MNANKVRQIIITCVSLVTLIVVAAAFTVAWYLEDIADPYTFNITADGVLYVYVGSTVVDSGKSFAPAVSKAGAIREGLSYDVLAVSDSIEKTAEVAVVSGDVTIYNEGYRYEKVELPKDTDGYTLYPYINTDGTIKWVDDGDHSQGWVTRTLPTAYDGEGKATAWSSETDYEPALNSDGTVKWLQSYTVGSGGEWLYLGQEYWQCKQQVMPGSTSATVNYNLRFKKTSDTENDDYYDGGQFTVTKIYFTSDGTESGAKTLDTQSEDKKTGSFLIYGSEALTVCIELHLTYPDELLDPELRGSDVYIAVGLSVSVSTG